MGNCYQLYGSKASYFTGKVRAYLRYKGISYTEHQATLKVYKELILPRTGVHYIPVLISPDNIAVQDSTDIIDFLEQRFPNNSVYPDTPLQKLVALLFEVYADEWLILPAMHYRWNFKRDNLAFILEEFGGTALPNSSKYLKRFAGLPTAVFFASAVGKVVGVTNTNIAAIETWTEEFFIQFNQHLEQHDFLLGSKPSIGDFGLMGPLYAHLYRDPYPGKLMRKIAPRVVQWVERMNAADMNTGSFLADDEVPDTVWPMLHRMFSEQFPVLQDTIERVASYAQNNPAKRNIPRFIGTHQICIGGVQEKRKVFSFSQWMFQRPLFFYQSLSAAEKQALDPLLKQWGGYQGMQTQIRYPLERHQNKLRTE